MLTKTIYKTLTSVFRNVFHTPGPVVPPIRIYINCSFSTTKCHFKVCYRKTSHTIACWENKAHHSMAQFHIQLKKSFFIKLIGQPGFFQAHLNDSLYNGPEGSHRKGEKLEHAMRNSRNILISYISSIKNELQ